jgi:hypothetical protein
MGLVPIALGIPPECTERVAQLRRLVLGEVSLKLSMFMVEFWTSSARDARGNA